MIRVLRVVTRLNIGGPSIQAVTLSDRLRSRGFETRLVFGRLGDGEGDMRYLLPSSLDARRLEALRRPIDPIHDPIALAQIFGIMREFRPQIVHTHMAKAGTIGRSAAALYNLTAGRHGRARIVHTYHGHVLEGYFSPAKTRAFLSVERGLAHLTDRIVAISPSIRSELINEQRIGASDQYRVVPLGFDLDRLSAVDDEARRAAREALGIPTSARVVTTVGRLTAIKRHSLFLDAAALVAAREPAALFVIAGDGELRQDLERLAASLGIAQRVRFLGWRKDLATIYGASDLFLLTSANEGTPVALIESLAAGVPAVSTDVGGVRDVVESTDVGLLAPSGDAAALAQHVLTLFADADRRRAMGARGRQLVVQRYQLDRLVGDVEALYRELIE